MSKESEEKVETCGGCKGSGQRFCYQCGGDGKCPSCTNGKYGGGRTCGVCEGTGACYHCNGSGIAECIFCNGKGYVTDENYSYRRYLAKIRPSPAPATQTTQRENIKVPSSEIEEFYRAVTSWGFGGKVAKFKKCYECLVRIGRASGFDNQYESPIVERGMCVVALENTSEAATAIAMFTLTFQGLEQVDFARCLIRMTTPAAASALDELIRKARNSDIRKTFERYRHDYDEILNYRRQPITHVFIDTYNFAKASGYRIGRTNNIHRSAYYGWIKSNGSCTLGLPPALESNSGELVFNTMQEAYRYAKQRNWVVYNSEGFEEYP